MQKRYYQIALFCTFIFAQLHAQYVGFNWAKKISAGGSDAILSVVTDAAGNIYTTGYFTHTIDLDPGPGTYTIASTNNSFTDLFISKLDINGDFVWGRVIGGTGEERANSIQVDAAGNVFVTGFFNLTVDFDPGPGTYTMSAATVNWTDIFVLKLDASGNFAWVRTFGDVMNDQGLALSVDASGDVITTGFFTGTVDFDPGPGTYTLTTGVTQDVFVLKLSSAGNFMWAGSFGSAAIDRGYAIDADAAGNVHVTGVFQGIVDFDPGPSTYTLDSGGSQNCVFIIKLNTSGNFVWAVSFAGGFGNGTGYGIAIDGSGNVLTTGQYSGLLDFDPGPAIYTINNPSQDAFVSKLDASGNFVWAKGFGAGANDIGNAVAVDATGNVCFTGKFQGPVDFDPGPATYTIGSAQFDIFITRLDPSGNFLWAKGIGGNFTDTGYGIATFGTDVITAGQFEAVPDFDPGPNTFLISATQQDGFIQKMSMCTPIQPGAISGPTLMCVGSSNTYSFASVTGASFYTWNLPSGWSGTSTTNTINTIAGNPGFIQVTASSNSCGAGPVQSLSISAQPIPTITANNGSVCIGNSFTITPSGASTYTVQGGNMIVSPVSSTSYTLAGTSTAGCVSSTISCNVIVNPLPTITVNSGTVCSGSSFTIQPGGASTYSFQGGNSIVNPSTNSTYTVTGTNSLGCVSASAAVCSITAVALPTITALSNQSILCVGQSATLTANGAFSYVWSPGGPGASIVVNPLNTTSYIVTGTDQSTGCTNTTTVMQNVSPCTNIIGSFTDELIIKLGPNPNNGIFEIFLDAVPFDAEIILLNILGQKIHQQHIRSTRTMIDLDLSKGIYNCKIISGKLQVENIRILVQ